MNTKEISETWSTDSGEYRYHGKKVDAGSYRRGAVSFSGGS